MRKGPVLWTTCLMFGALLYAESVGYWPHPAYRLFLMITMLSWAGFLVWTPRSD
jgi:sugar phosphate permease